MQSGETHLEPEGEVDGPAADVHEHDDADTPAAEEDDVLVDEAQTDSDTDDVIVPVTNQVLAGYSLSTKADSKRIMKKNE